MESYRSLANDAEDALLGVNEQILQQIHRLYIPVEDREAALKHGKKKQPPSKELGLEQIATALGMDCLHPRKKVTILIIGNHSAGKSSFVNWYVGEHVQRTGVAIETSGFTIVTSGKLENELKGEGTLLLYPHLRGVMKDASETTTSSASSHGQSAERFPGFVSHLTTKISTSKENKFALVDFIDTPGLADGNLSYPFDVDQVIPWMANHVDLIFVFFDPIGQALCSRTMNIVEKLHKTHSDKMRFYMTKADHVRSEPDRYKVMCQITQNLSARISAVHGFKLPLIYIPGAEGPDQPESTCINQIDELTLEIDKTISQKIQSNLNTLQSHCNAIAQRIDTLLVDNEKNVKRNREIASNSRLVFFFALLLLCLPLSMGLFMIQKVPFLNQLLPDHFNSMGIPPLHNAINTLGSALPSTEQQLIFIAATLGVSLLLMFISSHLARYLPTMSNNEIRKLKEWRMFIDQTLKKKEELYLRYFDESVSHEYA
eukprot:GILK01002557.1.p1 GENE.GILK01002557.1~~GILK01002557.1.p1  ORF type:complete len:514 (+),score=89.53 GILK01002557.1:83-1543(+)